MKICRLCENLIENDDKFCKYHKNAKENLNSGYEIWKKRVEYIET